MGVSIPMSWLKCASCGEPLTDAQSAENENAVRCANCGAVNKFFATGGGCGGGQNSCYMGNGGSGKHSGSPLTWPDDFRRNE